MMKAILIVSHCVLNSYCEKPEAPSTYRRQLLEYTPNNDVSILQLPCPELSYQALERESIYPGTDAAKEYASYCKTLLAPVIGNLKEYKKHGIKIKGIVGVDTSPSCSVADPQAIMMRILLEEMKRNGIVCEKLVDMPV